MNLRTYQAYTMSQALDAVKRDLGSGAVILHTRTFKRWRFPSLWRRTIVEVTATVPQQQTAPARSKTAKPASASAAAARRAYAAPVAAKSIAPTPSAADPLQNDRERTRRLALAMAEQLSRKQAKTTASESQASLARVSTVTYKLDSTARSPESNGTSSVQAAIAPAFPAAKRFILSEPNRSQQQPSGEAMNSIESASLAGARTMQEELNAIRTMVGEVLQRQSGAPGEPSPQLPQQLLDMYLRLIEQDLSEDLADQVVRAVRQELDEDDLGDTEKVSRSVRRQLERIIPVASDTGFTPNADGRPVVIALVGPTGVGKTTTLAKLAATCKLHHNLRVGLITADTYRIAAVEQLRTYANIIGLPLDVVLTPKEMRQAVARLSDGDDDHRPCDVILIDTAGRSQNDTGRIDELREFVNAAQPDQVHLVLSSTAGERVLLKEAEAFSPLGIHRIVLTKLDEAVSFGMLINVVRKVGKQLSYVTTGQEVPEHLEAGRADRLAELVMGGAVRT